MKKLYGIELLRGTAALMVIATHLQFSISLSTPADLTSNILKSLITNYGYIGDYGVEMFFLISGFVIYSVAIKDDTHIDWIQFAIKRLIRIIPLYWILTILVAVLAAWTTTLKSYNFTWLTLFYSLLFIPWSLSNETECKAVLYLGWTLNFEMLFYFMSTLVLATTKKNKFLVLSSIIVFSLIAGRASGLNESCYIFSNYFVLDFLAGMFVAIAVARINFKPSGIVSLGLWLIAILFFIFIGAQAGERAIRMIVPSAILIFVACKTDFKLQNTKTFAAHMGSISYALYLVHPFFIRLCEISISRSTYLNNHAFIPIFLTILGSYFTAVILNKYVDTPIRTFFQDKLTPYSLKYPH